MDKWDHSSLTAVVNASTLVNEWKIDSEIRDKSEKIMSILIECWFPPKFFQFWDTDFATIIEQ